jgi:hypothetical protein
LFGTEYLGGERRYVEVQYRRVGEGAREVWCGKRVNP